MKEKYRSLLNNIHVVMALRLFIILLMLSFSRIALYLFNSSQFASFSSSSLLQAYFVGFRFDFFVLSSFGLVFILGNSIPFSFIKNKRYQRAINIITLLAFSFAIILNFIDSVFYRFTLKRMTYEIVAFLKSDGGFIHLLPSFIVDFWYVVLSIIITIFLMVKLFLMIKLDSEKELSERRFYLRNSLYFLLWTAFIIIGIRGGTQLIPISIVDASKSVNPQLTPLALNTPFTMIKSYGKKGLPELSYFSEEEANEIFYPVKSYKPLKDVPDSIENLVIIIVESFSSEHSGYLSGRKSFTPFLDSLMQESLVFKGTANGKRSIEGIPAILSSLPTFSSESFLNGPYAINQIEGLARTLNKNGYESAFYHGGRNGTMNFDAYAKSAGFEQYVGMDDYPNEEDYDGHWGIWDEEFLQFFEEELNGFNEPFFATVFTLSSHHPYSIPKKYEDKFPKGKHEIQESFAYTDFAIKAFFKKASTEAWFNKTLFVITADHTSEGTAPEYKNNLGQFSIPIVFYTPSDTLLKRRSHKSPVQQTDIFPSIIQYLGIQDSILYFGNSVFSEEEDAFAVNYYGNYQVLDSSYLLQFSGSDPIALYAYKKDSLLENNLIDSIDYSHLLRLQQAISQQYNMRMIQNKLQVQHHD